MQRSSRSCEICVPVLLSQLGERMNFPFQAEGRRVAVRSTKRGTRLLLGSGSPFSETSMESFSYNKSPVFGDVNLMTASPPV